MHFVLNFICFSLLAALPYVAQAELTRCDGVWTDRPCQGTPDAKLTAAPPKQARSAAEVVNDDKQLVVHGLVADAFDARYSYGIDFSTRSVESQCALEKTSLETCIDLVRDANRDLRRLVLLEKKARAAVPTGPAPSQDADYSTNIVVIEDDYPDFVNRPGRPGLPHRPGRPNRPDRPDFDTGQNANTKRPGSFEGYRSRFR